MSKLDKVLMDSMQFHMDVERRAQAMEIWVLVHVIAFIASLAFIDFGSWQVGIPVFLFVNGAVISYQRYKLEPELVKISSEDSEV